MSYKGDHDPRHVHVYRSGKLLVKWNIEDWCPITGRASAKLKRLLATLQREGLL